MLMLNRDRAERKFTFGVCVVVIRLCPSRIRPVRRSPADRHNIARVLIQDMGLVKVLLVPSKEQRLVPTMGLGALDSWEG